MQLKEVMLKALDSFGEDGIPMKKQVESVKNEQELFFMYQVMREVFLKEFADSEKAPFQAKAPDGKVVMVKNLDEYVKLWAKT